VNPTIIVSTAAATPNQKTLVFVGRAALQRRPKLAFTLLAPWSSLLP
jgi:hypothetical protein